MITYGRTDTLFCPLWYNSKFSLSNNPVSTDSDAVRALVAAVPTRSHLVLQLDPAPLSVAARWDLLTLEQRVSHPLGPPEANILSSHEHPEVASMQGAQDGELVATEQVLYYQLHTIF